MRKYDVLMIDDAEKDIQGIYQYVVKNDSHVAAEHLLNKMEEVCDSLTNMPERGHYPAELLRLDIRLYREVHFKPYRVIYQIIQNEVYIHCVLDGRRDIEDLLRLRLLRD